MTNYIDEIESEMARQLEKLKNTPFINKAKGVIEVIRAIDDIFCYYSYVLPKDSENQESFYLYFRTHTNGFYECYEQLCYDEEKETRLHILYPSSEASRDWANYTLQLSGTVGFIYRYIQLTKQGVFGIEKKSSYEVVLKCKMPSGAEYLETRYQKKYLNNIVSTNLNSKRLNELEPVAYSELEKNVFIWNTHFIKYNTTPSLNEYYLLQGGAYIGGFVGNDAFNDESLFNKIPYKVIKGIIQGFVANSSKHLDFCQVALRKYGIEKLNQWNFYSTLYNINKLVEEISTDTGIDTSTVRWVTDILTLTKDNLKIHLNAPGSSLPPLIKIEKDYVIRSLAGLLSNPFTYLIRCLKHHCPQDYFNAVNGREKRFQENFYSLFESPNVIKCNRVIELKQGKTVLTDIDAMLFDIKEKSLTLVQLKWMDDFGTSMQQRKSMKSNFNHSIRKWIDNVQTWLENNGPTSLLKYFTMDAQNNDVKNINFFVLGRHFSQFSDEQIDNEVAYCAWPQLVEIVKHRKKTNDSMNALMKKIKTKSVKKINLNIVIPSTKYSLGPYSVTIQFD